MQLKRAQPPQRLISLVSMIDVLLIMLVFFMVTSTYLNLDMIPMAQSRDDVNSASSTPVSGNRSPMMLRLSGDGQIYLQGRIIDMDSLTQQVASRIEDEPDTPVLVLPSARATTQSLVSLMDMLTQTGVTHLRIVQLAVTP